MKIRDLGALDAPVLLFGGPYSNLAALRAVLREAELRAIPASHQICTGDLVAYCAEAAETVALSRSAGFQVVAGNCEIQLAQNAMDCGCGFEDGTACDLLSAGWYAHADQEIGPEDRAWMGALPDLVTFTHCGRRFAVIHGGVRDVARFLWPVSPEKEFAEEITALRAEIGAVDAVIAGHSGITFERQVAGVDWINAGVIGMPPNDGHAATRFAILQGGTVEIRQLDYDHRKAAEAMAQAGLTQGYHLSLGSGYWPSEDVLPSIMRRSASSANG